MNTENSEKLNKLALDVLHLSRNTLLVNLRFLDMALSQLQFVPTQMPCQATNGEYLIYNSVELLKSYKNEKETVVRDYLHIIMHCIFRHMFLNPTVNRVYWDLACDIAVENSINELKIKTVETKRARLQHSYISKLKTELNILTAEKLYAYLVGNVDEAGLEDVACLFYADSHEIWYMSSEQADKKYGLNQNQDFDKKEDNSPNSNPSDSKTSHKNSDDNASDSGDETDNEGSDSTDNAHGNDGSNSFASAKQELESRWKNISERMQTDLETFSKLQGDKAGGLVQNLKAVNREKYDYTAFLKKFAILGEAMKVNDDEFDYIFYTYGLKLYDKMPLIEPLEYKEVKRIKEFVIAIDTSGSVEGELVQAFVQKTYNVLKSTESFFSKINLHIKQCDAEIQEHVKITKQEEFDKYLETMEIKGLGGTDFRPVFNLVNDLVRNKEFTNLKGLIYFTDGYGEFPQQKPGYDTAFVFIDDEYNNPDVPPWAIKLVLQKDEV